MSLRWGKGPALLEADSTGGLRHAGPGRRHAPGGTGDPTLWSPGAPPHLPGTRRAPEHLLSPPLLPWENWEVGETRWGVVLEMVLP